MMGQSLEGLTDLVYEAALVPEMWPKALEAIARTVDAAGGVLFTADRDGVEWWTSAPATADVMHAFVSEGWMARNTRAFRQIAQELDGFATDLDLYTADEIAEDPLHRDLLYPHGFGWAAGTVIRVPTGDLLVYNIERRLADGPFPRDAVATLDVLRPHLARAGLLAARIGAERARVVTQSLGLVGLPAAVISVGSGRLRAANALFEALMPEVARERQGRLALADPPADTLLADALARRAPRAQLDATLSIPVRARDGRCPYVFHLVPVRGVALDLLPSESLLAVVTPVDRPAVPSASVIQGLFDLTPAEASLARALGDGRSLSGFAQARGVSSATLRSQLKSIFAKTGLQRQSDLVALLGGLAVPRRPAHPIAARGPAGEPQ